MKKRILALVLVFAMCLSMGSMFTGCKKKEAGNVDAFVIMTEPLDGLFNPFYYTSGPDGTIVGMTQIGMLSSKYVNGEVEVAYGDNEAVVVKDYDIVENGDTTVYTFVLKNGIKYSDGHPLTMEDVLFNYYVYLDPVYTGSSTLYSTDIVGLTDYRTQSFGGSSSDNDDRISADAAKRAQNRIFELLNLYISLRNASATSEVSYEEMKDAISKHTVGSGYQSAISTDPSSVTNKQLQADYDYALKLFKEELGRDYVSAQESFTDAPYDTHEEFKDEIFCFMFYEGYVHVEYAKDAEGKEDKTKIESMNKAYPDNITSKEAAINYIYNDKIATSLDQVLTLWGTAGTLNTEYTAKAKEVILQENAGEDGLAVKNISGIVSLGHTDAAGSTITVNGKDYTVASGHNADGTVTNASEYDVLQITINGIDPKAIWNFAISVAPQHYYGEGSKVGVDIANDQFGVEFASFDFMSKIIQSPRNVKLPMGAGSYKVTDANNSDAPAQTDFYKDNVVYFKFVLWISLWICGKNPLKH